MSSECIMFSEVGIYVVILSWEHYAHQWTLPSMNLSMNPLLEGGNVFRGDGSLGV